MKIPSWAIKQSMALLGIWALAWANQPDTFAAETNTASEFSIIERSAHHRVWQKVSVETNTPGGLLFLTNGYAELVTGMHFKNELGEWEESREEIEILPNNAGAIAAKGQHKVIFPPEIKTGIIELQTPDGQWLRSRVWGLAYFDSSSGESVLLAEVKESEGQLIGNNVVNYPDAFTNLLADIRYTYRLAGFEQDIVLRERPPLPESLNLNPQTTRLQVLTEFVEAQVPEKQERQAGGLSDETLGFGKMRIGPGKAFSVDSDAATTGHVPVAKQWKRIEGRDFLIEQVLHEKVAAQLQKLPAAGYEGASLNRRGQGETSLAGLKRMMPKRYVKAAPRPEDKPKRMAKAGYKPGPSFVMDYVTLTSETDYIFKSDTTYYIAGTVNLSGTTTIEGGTVVKFAPTNIAQINIIDPDLIDKTDTYRPAVFTARDDGSVGYTINGSTASPSGYYGGGLYYVGYWGNENNVFNNVRFCHLQVALSLGDDDSQTFSINNAQWLHCNEAIYLRGELRLRNCLFNNIVSAFTSSEAETFWIGEHLTVNRCENFVNAHKPYVDLFNSLLISVTNLEGSEIIWSVWTTNQVVISSDAGVFQTVGAGAHYLATNSPYRNIGTTNINATLLASLKKKTTYPPLLRSNITVTTATVLEPQVQRDTDLPDLGYHYDPIDYLACMWTFTNTSLTLIGGVAIGYFDDNGIFLKGGTSIHSEGTPTAMNRFVHYKTIQEQTERIGTTYPTCSGFAVNSWRDSGAAASGFFRFTEFQHGLAGVAAVHFFYSNPGWEYSDLTVRDCFFGRGNIDITPNDGGTFRFENNVFESRPYSYSSYILFLDSWTGYDFTLTLRNNTFFGGYIYIENYGPNTWTMKDNVFDSMDVGDWSDPQSERSHNAYIKTAQLSPAGTGDIVISNFTWAAGPLGKYYQQSTNSLMNAGSTNAHLLGLYHYTVTTNLSAGLQIKETNSIVDIGFHYVAVSTDGAPIDTDGDGSGDYFEDSDGDGVVESGDTDWNNAHDLGLRVFITRPRSRSTLP